MKEEKLKRILSLVSIHLTKIDKMLEISKEENTLAHIDRIQDEVRFLKEEMAKSY